MANVFLTIEYFNNPSDGKPISGGRVFIGQVDLDPIIEANRINVTVQQEDGTDVVIAPSAQPLTLSPGGRFQYLGSPVQISVSQNYSIRVDDSLGNQVFYVPDAKLDTTVPITTSLIYIKHDTVAAMVADATLSIGDFVITSGYYVKGDGGGNRYEIVAAGTGTEDLGEFIDLVTFQAVNDSGQIIEARKYGLKGDGTTNDTTQGKRFISYAENRGGGNIHFSAGTYKLTNLFVQNDNIHITGDGEGSTELSMIDNLISNNRAMIIFGLIDDGTFANVISVDNCSISNMSVDGNRVNQFNGTAAGDGSNHGVSAFSCQNFHAFNLDIFSCDGYGIGLTGSSAANRINQRVHDVIIRDCKYDGVNTKMPDLLGLTFDNIYVHTPAQPTASGRSNSGLTINADYARVSNCLIKGTDPSNEFNVGLWVPGDPASTNTAGDDILISNCVVRTCDVGLVLSGNDGGLVGVSNVTVDDCDTNIKLTREGAVITLVNVQSRDSRSSSCLLTNDGWDGYLKCVNCDFSGSAQDGVYIAAASDVVQKVSFVDCNINNNTRHGMNLEGDINFISLIDTEIKNNDQGGAGSHGVLVAASLVCDMLTINHCQLHDDQGVPTQNTGITFGAATITATRVLDSYFSGNTSTAIGGTFPVGIRILNNEGFNGLLTLSDGDTTPSVLGRIILTTANAAPTTITTFDDAYPGQEFLVIINDANTTIDFTASTLKGNGGVDWTPALGDFMTVTFSGSNFYCSIETA